MPPSLNPAEIRHGLQGLHADWIHLPDTDAIRRQFKFTNYYQTMAFANSVAWVAHRHNHHPDMLISYNRCQLDYTTHSAGGLTELDFSCARAIDMLLL